MSLDDQFNRENGTFIGRIDNGVYKLIKRIGNFYQDKTHKSVDSLKRSSYGVAGVSLGSYCALEPSIIMVLPSLACVSNAITNGRFSPKSSLEGEIQSEASFLPKNFVKYTDLIFLGLGSTTLLYNGIKIINGMASGSSQEMSRGIIRAQYSIGTILWGFGNYLNKMSFGDPPPKPKKEPLLERLKEKIRFSLPQPSPVPSPL